MDSEREVTIRTARAEDLPAVRVLVEQAGLPVDGIGDPFGDGYAVAEVEASIVAAAGVEVYGTHGLLRSVVVSPEWQGHGLGERITRDRLRWAEQKRLGSLFLLTTTAQGYFPRLGFVEVSRDGVPEEVRSSREFASVCPSTAVVMSRVLEDACATR